MKYTYLIISLSLFILPTVGYGQPWQCISTDIGENAIYHLIVDQLNPHKLLAASHHNLYQTADQGKTWKRIFRIKDDEERINFISTKPLETDTLYIGTQTTLYRSHDRGKRWYKIHSIAERESDRLRAFAIDPFNPAHLALGTSNGLLLSTDEGQTWTKSNKAIKNAHIYAIAFHPNIKDLSFISSEKGVYKCNREKTFEQTLSFRHMSEEDITADTLSHSDPTSQITFHFSEDHKIVITKKKQIYISDDYGVTWKDLFFNFSNAKYITNIHASIDDETLYITYPNEIITYNYNTKNELRISDGVWASTIYDSGIYQHKESILYSATDRGIFATVIMPPPIEPMHNPIEIDPDHAEHVYSILNKEPSVGKIQQRAIAYANVGNNKIRRWHRNARLRGLIPALSIDIENSIENNIDIDRGSTSQQDVYINGPEEKALSWTISLEWELANILWNANQTAIDYREKYMIEMREDILNEVTRLYFERKKAQLELYFAPPSDDREYLDLCLRIDELTAHIDSLTGGYLSERINHTAASRNRS